MLDFIPPSSYKKPMHRWSRNTVLVMKKRKKVGRGGNDKGREKEEQEREEEEQEREGKIEQEANDRMMDDDGYDDF